MTSQKNHRFTLFISFIAGVVFALGLIISSMVDPNKVISFLRVFNHWDPSLGLVMESAIAVAMPAFFYAKYRIKQGKQALDGGEIQLPTRTTITFSLVIGSLMFGVGWGLLGFCPAPALVTALAGYGDAIIFLVAMLVGFWLHSKLIVAK